MEKPTGKMETKKNIKNPIFFLLIKLIHEDTWHIRFLPRQCMLTDN